MRVSVSSRRLLAWASSNSEERATANPIWWATASSSVSSSPSKTRGCLAVSTTTPHVVPCTGIGIVSWPAPLVSATSVCPPAVSR
jgi:hypothetical protein